MKRIIYLFFCVLFASCATDMQFVLPEGPEGPPGAPGKSAYETWFDFIQGDTAYNGGYAEEDFFLYLKGEDGEGIGDMNDYLTIGDNNNWFIGGEDTGVPVNGADGTDGLAGESAYQMWSRLVIAGQMYKNDVLWPVDEFSEYDFWLYLTGPKGDDGIDAYEEWVEKVTDTENPVENPHNPGEFWDPADDKDGTDWEDYWWFFSGDDAYALWVRDVLSEEGLLNHHTEDDTDDLWPKEKILKEHFWEYLRGKNGEDGLGAYEQWVEDIKGNDVPNPHENPNVEGDEFWPEGHNSRAYYYQFLSGMDGKSAYEIWKEEVAKGLDHPKTPGADWPKTQTDLEDFWRYLRGADGKDGGAFIIEKGVYNVIAQYQAQVNDEFVSPEDGSVTFYVYDKDWDGAEGTKPALVPFAKVKGIPGLDPDLELTANAEGHLKIGKDLLPQGKSDEDRFGFCLVSEDGVIYKESAPNTYVPEKVDIRFRLRGTAPSTVRLASGNVRIDVVVERRTERYGAWERMPEHLAGGRSLAQSTHHYHVADSLSHDIAPDAEPWGSYAITGNISSATAWFDLGRPRVYSPYLNNDWVDIYTNGRRQKWDGSTPQYIVTRLESYYGEKAQLVRVDGLGTDNEKEKPVIFRRVPIQYLPIIKDVQMGTKLYDSTNEVWVATRTSGTFELSTVEYKYFYKTNLYQRDQTESVLVTPEVMDTTEVNAKKLLRVQFVKSLDGTNNILETQVNDAITLGAPEWTLNGSNYDGADVCVITTDANMFSGVKVLNSTTALSTTVFDLGKSDFGEATSLEGKIVGNKDDITKPTGTYKVPDITITFAPQ